VGEGRGRVLYRSLAFRLHLDVEPSSFYPFGAGGRLKDLSQAEILHAQHVGRCLSGATGWTAVGAMSTGRCTAMAVDRQGASSRRWGTKHRSVWLEIIGGE
jgi:hypothetical protein